MAAYLMAETAPYPHRKNIAANAGNFRAVTGALIFGYFPILFTVIYNRTNLLPAGTEGAEKTFDRQRFFRRRLQIGQKRRRRKTGKSVICINAGGGIFLDKRSVSLLKIEKLKALFVFCKQYQPVGFKIQTVHQFTKGRILFMQGIVIFLLVWEIYFFNSLN